MVETENKVVETKKKQPKKPAVSSKKLRIDAWQKAAELDGFMFGERRADGGWDSACEAIAKVAVVKCRTLYTNRNLTVIVQNAVGVEPTGMCDKVTHEAIRKYQRANKLFPNGEVGLETWKKILKV